MHDTILDVFIGRDRQLGQLQQLFAGVGAPGADSPGKAVLVRGRRRVGKSRLIEVFLERADVPHVYFTASTRSNEEELRLFAAEMASSTLPGAALFADVVPGSWDAALRLLAAALPADRPSVVVLDELPYLTAADPGFEGTLQKLFDRELRRKPVLLIGIGSDLAMMEALNSYGRPFHQRAAEMVVPPLSPLEVGEMLDLSAADAFDAYLVTGGLPLICSEWPRRRGALAFLRAALRSPTSALLVSGERALAAEFPAAAQAKVVLGAIAGGERTFTNVGRAAGGLPAASLSRALELLTDKRIVQAERPLSTQPSRETRYWVADPYLRFYLSFLERGLSDVERGRGDRVVAAIERSWTSWRGRAIEPVVRESLSRLAGVADLPESAVWGGFWTRTNVPEVDLVAADRAPIARVVHAVGSIKWLERAPFNDADAGALARVRSQVPGAGDATSMVAVSRSGCTASGLRVIGPEELLQAWR
jgi:AAA+ ATPase superfamily predicted ATPase